ncbi:MAG TPA: SURF1 family protein [Acidimicrobiales bacterium]|nr:SURF1 family protein [Acidimicrobiales bacterium]
MYRFALRPLWILSHLFALACVVAFVGLGLWQLDRHDQRAERNATIEARADLPADPIADALRDAGDDDEALRFRTVAASGTYGEGDLLVDNRSKDGLPGAWVLTPLVLDDGTTLVVNRGFQFNDGGRVDPEPAPDGPVSIEGTATTWEDDGCGVRRDDAGEPVGMACLRRSAAEEAFGGDVLPVVVQRQTSTPPAADALAPVPLPELDAGPHRSYAVQWFIFAALTAIVYVLILRRVAHRVGERADDADGA